VSLSNILEQLICNSLLLSTDLPDLLLGEVKPFALALRVIAKWLFHG
jgi:hypothetical protein